MKFVNCSGFTVLKWTRIQSVLILRTFGAETLDLAVYLPLSVPSSTITLRHKTQYLQYINQKREVRCQLLT